jgi:hypothetical protein
VWCESGVCLSVSLALALPLEQRPKLSFLTPPSTLSLNSLMTFIILAGIQFNSILFIYYLLFMFHLQQLVAFLVYPFCPTGFWDGEVLMHPYLYAHYSITFYLGFETHKLGFWDRQ